ncbi:methyltransferase [Thermodesulfobacteriota bacterium]
MEIPEWNPGKLTEVSGSYWMGCTLHAGVRLDVFTIIGNDVLSAEEITQKINGDPRAVDMLLNALVAMGLLEKKENRFSNTTASSTFLSKDSPKYTGYIIKHHSHLVESWSQLVQAVLEGKPQRSRTSFGDEEIRESFLMGMFNMATKIAPEIVELIDLKDRHHLLDLGGGPGTYAIHFCMKNPRLKATVYDLATTRPFAEKTIAQFNLTDRIDFQAGDYVDQGVEGQYDVAWLSHILHGEGPEDCHRIVRKAASALEPGGMIIIHEFILDNSMDKPLFPALFSLNMLLGTESGQAYSEQQLRNMLSDAGAGNIERLPYTGPTESGIIMGIV